MEFQDLPTRIAEVRGRIDAARSKGGHGQGVRIVAVTKTHGPDAVMAAMAAGLTDIGENRVQEAMGKQDALAGRAAVTGGIATIPAPGTSRAGIGELRWHLIGHLQRNKVKHLDRFGLFHAVDSTRLADAIVEQGRKMGRAFDVLLEVNVSGEVAKGGFDLADLRRECERLARMGMAAPDLGRPGGDSVPVPGTGQGGVGGLRVRGVMTMAPLDADEATLRRVFAGARAACETCRAAGHPAYELSMGMSGDYEIAVEEGATMVRLGTILFGERGQ